LRSLAWKCGNAVECTRCAPFERTYAMRVRDSDGTDVLSLRIQCARKCVAVSRTPTMLY
jgi:hypothetical protein